jgi:hypothetical protein
MAKRTKMPTDLNQRAKRIVELTTTDEVIPDPDAGKDPAAVALGRKGGLKGGKARSEKLSAARRSEIAKKASAARWGPDD